LVSQAVKHRWPKNYKSAVALQGKLRERLVTGKAPKDVRLVAGVDVSYDKGSELYHAGVVVLSYPGLEVVEEAWASGKSSFPYIPGLLSFREGPISLAAFKKLKHRPDLVIFDGQGFAHPRGFGLACHIGLLLDIPSIGCAKSVLVGQYKEPGKKRGSSSVLVYKGETVGRALRTRDSVKPVFVSVGHRMTLDAACAFVLGCAKGYRLPEPTRLAHLLVNMVRRGEQAKPSPGTALTRHSPHPALRATLSHKGRGEAEVYTQEPPSPIKGEGKRKDDIIGTRGPGKAGLIDIYNALYEHYGPQHWWPGETPFEVMVGAILTQNTNWGNVEKAIANLKAAGALSPKAIHDMPDTGLASLIRPSGYFNIKAKRLKAYISYFMERYGGSVARMKKADCGRLREEILAVSGIGPETADSILLYALGCPVFVVDAYTRRIFSRHGFFPETSDYHDVQSYFTERIPKDVQLYNEYHALIVRLAKDRCLKKAGRCELCLLIEG
jgi:endonuclease III related protein